MDNITTHYLLRAETWLCLTTLVYFLMNGAQLFETIVIVPKWTMAPPESFGLFAGKYALDFKTFWIAMHSVHEFTFMLAIGFCWKLEAIRNILLILFVIHFAVRLWTLGYFAPSIIHFQKIANTQSDDTGLLNKAMLWKKLNYIRVGLFIAISLTLVVLCSELMNLKCVLF